MEIKKVMELSTGHVTEETADLLDLWSKPNAASPISVFNKTEYGWYIPVMEEQLEEDIPDDLKKSD